MKKDDNSYKKKIWVYFTLMIFGIILFSISLFLYYKYHEQTFWYDLCMSLGSGFFASAILGLIIDSIAERSYKQKQKTDRDYNLNAIPYSICFIVGQIIECFGDEKDGTTKSLNAFFDDDLIRIRAGAFQPCIANVKQYSNKAIYFSNCYNKFLSRISYGLTLYERDAKVIYDNRVF